ncbi:MAG: NAD-dependent epimerase/dehydratase family protein, partial [Flavobacteriales bacterium]|nr:NAD-dependent epimerase/dehydratase family protein [Flavobacteriales bacterium]
NAPVLNHPRIEVVNGDLLDAQAVSAFVAGCEAVVHAAARISIDSANDPLVRPVNVDGTRHIVEACMKHGVRRLVHFSSIHRFQALPLDRPLDESRPRVGDDGAVYDRTKADADELVLHAVREQGLNAVVLCPTAVIGPNDHGPSLLGKAIVDIHQGRIPVLVPGGYDLVDVRDVCASAVAALESGAPGSLYLLAGRYCSIKDLAALIGEVSGKRVPTRTLPFSLLRALLPLLRLQARLLRQTPLFTQESLDALEHGHADIRSDKAQAELGHRIRPLRETIADTLGWFGEKGILK